jgi:hypothetical protein
LSGTVRGLDVLVLANLTCRRRNKEALHELTGALTRRRKVHKIRIHLRGLQEWTCVMPSGLASDPLGRLGEAQFEQLCIAGGLIPNRSTYDRTGWDYLVEFPFSERPKPLDSRPSPQEVKVQVKTVGPKAGTFKIRLSSAERIAKYPQAAFVCVLVTDQQNNFQRLYVLVHVIGDLLSLILKELRKCTAKNSLQVNKRHLTLPFAKFGIPVAVSGPGLRRQLEETIGSNPTQYAAMKRNQLAELGFDAARYEGTFTVSVESMSELADILLGRKKSRGP